MGVEYTLVCDSAKEFVDPHAIDGQLGKLAQITSPKSRFGALAIFLLHDRWSGRKVRLEGEWDPPDGYRDVSLDAIREFCEYHEGLDGWGISPRADYEVWEGEEDETPKKVTGKSSHVRLFYSAEVAARGCAEVSPSRAVAVVGGDWAEVAPADVEGFVVREVCGPEGAVAAFGRSSGEWRHLRGVYRGDDVEVDLARVLLVNPGDAAIHVSVEVRGDGRVDLKGKKSGSG